MSRVLVVQDHVPRYREGLYREIQKQLAEIGADLKVISGQPSGHIAHRADSAEHGYDMVGSKTFVIPGLGQVRRHDVAGYVKSADLVVGELATLNATTWELLRERRRLPIVLWGHGGAFVQRGSLLRSVMESAVARSAAHIMTYTRAGKRMLVNNGVRPEKITAIGNSTDTAPLRSVITQAKLERHPRHFFYVGGLDKDKRIDFLIDAARAASSIAPDFHLTIYGKGELEQQVADFSVRHDFLTYAGRAGQKELVEAATRCAAVWMPGRVGLVAADCLALGLPMFSTDFNYHAPEIEFLVEGESLHTLSNDPGGYAEEALHAAGKLSSGLPNWPYPTVEKVAKRYARVVGSLLPR